MFKKPHNVVVSLIFAPNRKKESRLVTGCGCNTVTVVTTVSPVYFVIYAGAITRQRKVNVISDANKMQAQGLTFDALLHALGAVWFVWSVDV